MDSRERIAVVTRDTRLQTLLQRWSTRGAVKFRLKQLRAHQRAVARSSETLQALEEAAVDADFAEYAEEDERYQASLEALRRALDFGLPVEFVHRRYLTNFDFGRCALVVVVGQDGLVANVAKYVGQLPIVAVNPDPEQFDGILLPFSVKNARSAVARTLKGTARSRNVTLAEVELNDGQTLLGFNDLFIGTQSHVSARYLLSSGGQAETQSSSGVIVSTGAGSTGWFSSVFNMAEGVSRWLGGAPKPRRIVQWEDRSLLWAVREPFRSKHSQCGLVAGQLDDGHELVIESLMPERGVIFSDGIESDFLEFNSGTIARIRCARQSAKLVVG